MTLSETVGHIQAVDRVDQAAALYQFRMARADGDLPARWAADPPPLGDYDLWDPWPFSSDEVPTDPMYWFSVLIFLAGDGLVVDQRSCSSETLEHPLPRPRQLLLLRSRVFELWPPSDHERKDRGSTTQPEKLWRRKVEDDEIRSAARDIYRERENDPPNKPTAEQLTRQRLQGGKRDDLRKILEEDEFKIVRRKAGNQPKKPNLRNS
jgi:hypothetical protein